MARQPLDTREWLEDMLRFSSRDADRARELLRLLDDAEEAQNQLENLDERLGDIDKAQANLVEHEALIAVIESHEITKAFDDVEKDVGLQAALDYAAECEAQIFVLQELCVEAGLLGKNDHTTDPLPLLRMFLPVD